MKPHWTQEKWRLAGIIIAGLVTGLVSGHMGLSLSLLLLIYIIWQLRNLYLLDQWIEHGLKLSQAPESHGAWDNIIRNIYRLKTSRKRSKKKLAKMLGQFTASAAALPDATVILYENGEIQWFNSAACKLLGLQSPQDLGQRIDNLVRDPEFRSFLYGDHKDNRLQLNSPQDANVKLLLKLVKYGNENLLLTARDISERERLDTIRREFVSNASHELRTPLTVIRGYLEVMANDKDCTETTRENFATVLKHTDRMEHIIADLLTLSGLENTKLGSTEGEVVNVPVLLRQLTEDAVNSGLAEAEQINLVCDDELCLRGITSEITSVCTNLLHNALQHNPPGTRVEMKWSTDDIGVPGLVVSDEGQGIEPQHLPRIAERFYRVDSSRSRESGGTGLGLSIVKHIVQRHGGSMDISSSPGKGTIINCNFARDRALSCTEGKQA